MDHAKPLPEDLVGRYTDWRSTTYADHAAEFEKLAAEGQHPDAMIISCCDSRVNVTTIFGANQGDFFVHRNVAALVPPYEPTGDHHGTSAAVEYAVTALKVRRIIVLGHSKCGGVRGCYDMCSGNHEALGATTFVGKWMEILRPAYDGLPPGTDEVRAQTLEKRAVLTSIVNLAGFPFVKAARDAGELTLHGLWTDISTGELQYYDPSVTGFVAIAQGLAPGRG